MDASCFDMLKLTYLFDHLLCGDSISILFDKNKIEELILSFMMQFIMLAMVEYASTGASIKFGLYITWVYKAMRG